MEKGNYSHVLEAASHKRNNSSASAELAENQAEEAAADEDHSEEKL